MKTLAAAAVTLALIGAAPREAAAQEGGLSPGAIASTIVGAAIGGAVGYYYFTGVAATTIGVIGGGAIGDWWYTAALSRDGGTAGKMKMKFTDQPRPRFQLIGYSDGRQPGLHTAAFSAAAD
ncbi:MAG TPA: hypothetical protein VGS13_13725 [Stellaceae bacterium]|nr:hypothetical protein [Stellaceae bacterium]